MNPWLLHEVRKDDVESRYKEAERHRLAATLPDDPPFDADPGQPPARSTGRGRAWWAVALLAGTVLIVVMIVAAACGTQDVPAVAALAAAMNCQPTITAPACVTVAPQTCSAPVDTAFTVG